MRKRTKVALVAATVGTLLVGGGLAAAGGADDQDASETEVPITGDALERASQAALEHTGGGRVTDTEMRDEESFYEVEVTLADGSVVDVQLDEQFAVVGDERESDSDD